MNTETSESILLTERGKKAFLKALNERFSFYKDGALIPKSDRAHEPIILSEYLEEDDESGDK